MILIFCISLLAISILVFSIWKYLHYMPLVKRFFSGKINKWKIKRYKKKKILESKEEFDKDFTIKFKLVLNDNKGKHVFEDTEFDIVIPAKAAFFARRKLEKHLKENISIEIIDITD